MRRPRRILRQVLRRLPGRPWPPRRRLRRPPPCPPGWTTGPPDFVGVGVQKAGTSWWFRLIAAHPQVYTTRHRKELHFFERFWDEPFSERDVADYHRMFPRPASRVAGEWTPRYMYDFWTPPLLHAAAPDARILVLLRDPVERYRSGLAHDLGRGAPRAPLVADEALRRGLYHDQLCRLLEHFDRGRLLVLQYERCLEDPAGELRRTCRFLGLDPADFLPEGIERRVTRTRRRAVLDEHVQEALRSAYAEDVRRLVESFPEIDPSLWPNFHELARREPR